jgi:HEPN domain-containing protein
MLTKNELQKISRARLRDSEILLNSGRYDGAIYLCGYALEIKLKLRICKTLGWPGYPSTNKEFENLQSFKTHKLDILLRLSGIEKKIKENYLGLWSIAAEWDPEARYRPIGSATKDDAQSNIEAIKFLTRII